MTKREHEQLLREMRGRGYEITRTRNGHMRIVLPNGELVFAASTPSDRRSIKNLRALIKRKERR